MGVRLHYDVPAQQFPTGSDRWHVIRNIVTEHNIYNEPSHQKGTVQLIISQVPASMQILQLVASHKRHIPASRASGNTSYHICPQAYIVVVLQLTPKSAGNLTAQKLF